MTLPPGTHLGPYEILATLGSGGMGAVYRARDTRLDRTVAIKVLLSALADQPDARERFDREARTISKLTHPHICTVHDVGEAPAPAGADVQGSRVQYLVMEHLEGETLEARLARGALSIERAVAVGQQIAAALDAAHRQGILHRDLKPGNVMLTSAGVKLLDFGLAKLTAPAESSLSMLATVPGSLTVEGTILGTPRYMAPEQIEGRPIDGRVDLWALGVILYESIVGRPAFQAASQAALIGAILERPLVFPSDAPLPAPLKRLIQALTHKDPAERVQTAHDAYQQLQWIADDLRDRQPAAAPTTPARTWKRWPFVAAALAAVIALGVAVSLWFGGGNRPAGLLVKRFHIEAPPGTQRIEFMAASPDAAQLAFVAADERGNAVWVRPFGSLDGRRVADLQGTSTLFWSPDGRSLGFFDGGKLKVVEAATGQTRTIADAPNGHGGSWGPDGTIVFSPDAIGGVYRVSAQGGPSTEITVPDATRGDQGHRWPYFLPGGRRFLTMGWRNIGKPRYTIQLAALDSKETTVVAEDAISAAIYDGAGHMVFMTGEPPRLVAVPFDAQSGTIAGPPLTVAEDAEHDWVEGTPLFTAASDGMLVYRNNRYRHSRLTWFDRQGRPLESVGDAGVYYDPALSLDGQSLALERADPNILAGDLWIVDLVRRTFSRTTREPSFENTVVWSPDGRELVFSSDRDDGVSSIYRMRLGDPAPPASIFAPPASLAFATDWSRDGKFLLVTVFDDKRNPDLWLLAAQDGWKPTPMLASPHTGSLGRFSPDGAWIAYVSTDTGIPEVYLRSRTGANAYQVSSGGALQPQWRGDGRELFYLTTDRRVVAHAITLAAAGPTIGPPTILFKTDTSSRGIRNEYAVSQDGQRFLVLAQLADPRTSGVTAVINWRSGDQ